MCYFSSTPSRASTSHRPRPRRVNRDSAADERRHRRDNSDSHELSDYGIPMDPDGDEYQEQYEDFLVAQHARDQEDEHDDRGRSSHRRLGPPIQVTRASSSTMDHSSTHRGYGKSRAGELNRGRGRPDSEGMGRPMGRASSSSPGGPRRRHREERAGEGRSSSRRDQGLLMPPKRTRRKREESDES